MSIFAVALMFAVPTPDTDTAGKSEEAVKLATEEGTAQEGSAAKGKEKLVCTRVRHSVGSRIGGTRQICKTAAQTKAEKKDHPRDNDLPSSETRD